MGKNSRTKSLNQGVQDRLKLKIKSKKGRKQKVQLKKSEKGKPRGLNKTQLPKPDIWTSYDQDIKIIKFLIKQGRHYLIHLAGAKRSLNNEQNYLIRLEKEKKQEETKQKQSLFEFLETFSLMHLGMPEKKKKKERIVVFFFRNNNEYYLKENYQIQLNFQNKEWNKILKDIKFLLDQKFLQELIQLLHLFEEQVNIETITNLMIDEFNSKNDLKDIQVIFQNLLIQLIKQGKEGLNYENLQGKNSNQIFEIYQTKIYQYKQEVTKFISDLKELFDDSDQSKENQYKELEQIQSQYQENYFDYDQEKNQDSYNQESHRNYFFQHSQNDVAQKSNCQALDNDSNLEFFQEDNFSHFQISQSQQIG